MNIGEGSFFVLRVKTYHMTNEYLDVIATFPKLSCRLQDKPNENEKKEPSYWSELEEESKMELNKQRAIQRTKTKVKRYVIHRNMKYMWTLTFRTKKMEITSSKKGQTTIYDTGKLSDAWTLWKNFLKRCSRAGLKFDYIVTIEVQEERLETYGEKVYHFHFATNKNIPINMKYAKKRGMKHCMDSLWNHGGTYVTKSKAKKKFANTYIMKYITKMFDETSKGSQRYRCSENMQIPVTNTWFKTEEELDLYINKLAMIRDLEKPFKMYFPLSDGHNEVLYYGLQPKGDETYGKRGIFSKRKIV